MIRELTAWMFVVSRVASLVSHLRLLRPSQQWLSLCTCAGWFKTDVTLAHSSSLRYTTQTTHVLRSKLVRFQPETQLGLDVNSREVACWLVWFTCESVTYFGDELSCSLTLLQANPSLLFAWNPTSSCGRRDTQFAACSKYGLQALTHESQRVGSKLWISMREMCQIWDGKEENTWSRSRSRRGRSKRGSSS